MGLGLQICV